MENLGKIGNSKATGYKGFIIAKMFFITEVPGVFREEYLLCNGAKLKNGEQDNRQFDVHDIEVVDSENLLQRALKDDKIN